jgi:hypothetical protein
VLAMICEAQAFNIHLDRPCVNTIVAYGLAVLAAAQALCCMDQDDAGQVRQSFLGSTNEVAHDFRYAQVW